MDKIISIEKLRDRTDGSITGLHKKKYRLPLCGHRNKVICNIERTVQCKLCEIFIDPFDCLEEIVDRTDAVNAQVKEYRQEIVDINVDIMEAKKVLREIERDINFSRAQLKLFKMI